jgi:sec-independent protein translocase protein TatB
MFDVGFTELVLLFVIGLLILGPERLPRVAAQIGRWVARARRTANQLRMQLEREVALDEIRRAQEKTKRSTAEPKPPGDAAAGAAAPSDAAAPDAPAADAPSADSPASADTPSTAGTGAAAAPEVNSTASAASSDASPTRSASSPAAKAATREDSAADSAASR